MYIFFEKRRNKIDLKDILTFYVPFFDDLAFL